jgi:hypothetical protein
MREHSHDDVGGSGDEGRLVAVVGREEVEVGVDRSGVKRK